MASSFWIEIIAAYIIHAGAIRQNKMIRNYRNEHRSEQCNCFHDWRGGAQLLDQTISLHFIKLMYWCIDS